MQFPGFGRPGVPGDGTVLGQLVEPILLRLAFPRVWTPGGVASLATPRMGVRYCNLRGPVEALLSPRIFQHAKTTEAKS
jgi:hypothetical protein